MAIPRSARVFRRVYPYCSDRSPAKTAKTTQPRRSSNRRFSKVPGNSELCAISCVIHTIYHTVVAVKYFLLCKLPHQSKADRAIRGWGRFCVLERKGAGCCGASKPRAFTSGGKRTVAE